MKQKEIPILLLTGYLGSGKTTLVNRILANKRGIRFAVIVNDIGEVNIDASLIQKGGVVGKKDDSLVALQNGCICCTLKADLIEQVYELMKLERFDYIVIEASGICEPEPIAQTLCSIPRLGDAYTRYGICRLDCIVSVVDALRLQSEFSCGDSLTRKGLDEEDIDNIILGKNTGYMQELKERVREVTIGYVTELLGTFRELGIDFRTTQTVFMGGGAILVSEIIKVVWERFKGEYFIINDPKANAKGYKLQFQIEAKERED